jgi:transposase
MNALKAGNTRSAAGAYAGISRDSFTRWMASNNEFALAVEKAEADCEVKSVAIIQKAALTTWQAAAWWLERRRTDDWKLKQTNEHEGGITVTVVRKSRPQAVDTDADRN